MKKQLTKEELAEKELADKIQLAITELQFKRGNGITLEKDQYIGGKTNELEKQLSELKTKKCICEIGHPHNNLTRPIHGNIKPE